MLRVASVLGRILFNIPFFYVSVGVVIFETRYAIAPHLPYSKFAEPEIDDVNRSRAARLSRTADRQACRALMLR